MKYCAFLLWFIGGVIYGVLNKPMLLFNHCSLSWVGTCFLCALLAALRMCGPWTHWQHRMYHKVLFVHSCNSASLIEPG